MTCICVHDRNIPASIQVVYANKLRPMRAGLHASILRGRSCSKLHSSILDQLGAPVAATVGGGEEGCGRSKRA